MKCKKKKDEDLFSPKLIHSPVAEQRMELDDEVIFSLSERFNPLIEWSGPRPSPTNTNC